MSGCSVAAATIKGVAPFCGQGGGGGAGPERAKPASTRGDKPDCRSWPSERAGLGRGQAALPRSHPHLVGLVDVGAELEENLCNLDEAEPRGKAQGRVAILR